MNNIEFLQKDEMFKQLIIRALDGKQSHWSFIKNLNELHAINQYIRGIRKVIKIFSNLRKIMLINYSTQIYTGEQDIELVLALKRFQKCSDFYSKELHIAKDMRKEYREFVLSGHILTTLLGIDRKPNEMIDYRWF